MVLPSMMSCWLRFTTPIIPSLTGMTFPVRRSTASVPSSMMSSFVQTASVLLPFGSISRASFRASDVARSVLAAWTAKMMHLGFDMYSWIMSRICFSMSSGWSPTGTRVIPGRSMRVKFKTWGEKILRRIGSELMPLLLPADFSVSVAISSLIWAKSLNFLSPVCRNFPHPQLDWASSGLMCTNWSISGRRVTMPVPRGRKSRPTRFSRTELLPVLCVPTTAIWGS